MVGTGESKLALGEGVDQPETHRNRGLRSGGAPKLEHSGAGNINAVGGAVATLLVEAFDFFQSEDHGSAETGVGHLLIVAIGVDLTGGKDAIKCAGCPFGFALLFERALVKLDLPVLSGLLDTDGFGPVLQRGAFLQFEEDGGNSLVVAIR